MAFSTNGIERNAVYRSLIDCRRSETRLGKDRCDHKHGKANRCKRSIETFRYGKLPDEIFRKLE
jgi:hypothetical protein